jgi:Fur family transcriptional regulator, ferric uptake regulator
VPAFVKVISITEKSFGLTWFGDHAIATDMQYECDTNCEPCTDKGCCAEKYKAVLQNHGGRYTKERRDLLHAVCNIKGHFDAEQITEALFKLGRKVAATTIYRNLPLLIEAGIIRRTCMADAEHGTDRAFYEHVWGRTHHDHLICSACGKKVEFAYSAIEVLQEAVAREHGFTLEGHHLELIGLCPDCGDSKEARN